MVFVPNGALLTSINSLDPHSLSRTKEEYILSSQRRWVLLLLGVTRPTGLGLNSEQYHCPWPMHRTCLSTGHICLFTYVLPNSPVVSLSFHKREDSSNIKPPRASCLEDASKAILAFEWHELSWVLVGQLYHGLLSISPREQITGDLE